jgi:hypothetical protein
VRRALLLAFVMLGAGCASPADELVGSWTSTDAAGRRLTMKFDGVRYGTQTLAPDPSIVEPDQMRDQAESGVYAASDDQITFTPRTSSCPSPVPVWRASYGITYHGADYSRDVLVVTNAGDARSFTRYFTPAMSNATAFGCYLSDGSFAMGQLTSVGN